MGLHDVYGYVDVWTGTAKAKWDRIRHPSKAFETWHTKRQGHEAYWSIQRYERKEHTEDELALAPLFFDFDAEDLEQARSETQTLVGFLDEIAQVGEHTRVWFTGGRGFHVTASAFALGQEPSAHLHLIYEEAAAWCAATLDLKTLDTSIYTARRQWRMPHSRHRSTGLYKVELTASDLMAGMDHILGLAREPGEPLNGWLDDDQVRPCSPWWDRIQEVCAERIEHKRLQPLERVMAVIDRLPEGDPVCVQDTETNGLKQKGTRHKANFYLAIYYKQRGLTKEEAEARLIAWAKALPPDLSTSSERERIASARSTIKGVWNHDYHFHCRAMRSLGTPQAPVACIGEVECSFVVTEKATAEKVVAVNLDEATEARFHGHNGVRVAMKTYVPAIADAPYILPMRGRWTCQPPEGKPCCAACPNGEAREVMVSADGTELLTMAGAKDAEVYMTLAKKAGIPIKNRRPCPHAKLEILERTNLMSIVIQPHIDFRNRGAIDEDLSYRRNEVYLLGDMIRANQRYLMQGKTWPHPKNQRAVHIVDTTEPLLTVAESYVHTPEKAERLKAFQGPPEAVFEDVHNVLEQHAYQIWMRRAVAVGIDLVIHTPLHMNLWDKRFVRRGWGECLIVGDTDQGKSTIVERLFDYYGIGQIVSIETVTYVGLVGGAAKYHDQWMAEFGALCRNDRGIVALDECQNDENGILLMLNDIREQGKARLEKAAHGESSARCRKIFLSNPRSNLSLDRHQYGIEAVLGVFRRREQAVRRLDFAIALARQDAITKELTREHPITMTNDYPADLCQLLIQWSWSRGPDALVWTDAAVDAILRGTEELLERYAEKGALVSSGSQPIKLARLAASAAMRCYSTEDGERVVIDAAHVRFVVDFLKEIYDDPAMDYNGYSQYWFDTTRLSPEQEAKLRSRLAEILGGNRVSFMEYLNTTKWVRPSQIQHEWASEDWDVMTKKEKVQKALALLTKAWILERPGRDTMYVKTSKGIIFVADYLKNPDAGLPDIVASVTRPKEDEPAWSQPTDEIPF